MESGSASVRKLSEVTQARPPARTCSIMSRPPNTSETNESPPLSFSVGRLITVHRDRLKKTRFVNYKEPLISSCCSGTAVETYGTQRERVHGVTNTRSAAFINSYRQRLHYVDTDQEDVLYPFPACRERHHRKDRGNVIDDEGQWQSFFEG